jgi:hypothetical protein
MAATCIGIRMVGPDDHDHACDRTPLALLDRSWLGGLPLYQLLRPFAVGPVHGLAGSAAIALVVLTIVRDPILAAAYLLLFGIGTIGGMMLITLLLTAPFVFTSAKVQLATCSRIGLDQFCFWAVPRLRHRLRRWRSAHRQSEWATPPLGRAVQLRATWLILDLPSHEPGAAFDGVTVWRNGLLTGPKPAG